MPLDVAHIRRRAARKPGFYKVLAYRLYRTLHAIGAFLEEVTLMHALYQGVGGFEGVLTRPSAVSSVVAPAQLIFIIGLLELRYYELRGEYGALSASI